MWVSWMLEPYHRVSNGFCLFSLLKWPISNYDFRCLTETRTLWPYSTWKSYEKIWKNKPKEYPQQRETKTVAKHAMNEVCLLPRPFYSRGRACKLQSRHKHCMKKTFFQKRLRYCGQHARSSCKGFSSQRTAVRLTLHFIYLTYIIHIFFVLYITYIFYTIF